MWPRLVYLHHQGESYNIYYRTSADDGASWSPEKTVQDDDFNLFDPAVVGTPSGRVIVAWRVDGPEGRRIQYSTTDDGGATWVGHPTPYDPERVHDVDQPALAVAPSGDIWLIYRAVVEEQWGLWYQVSIDDGETWSGPERLQDGHHRTSIAGTTDGLVLAWQQGRWNDELGFHNGDVYYRTSDDEGATWSDPVRYTMYPDRDHQVRVAGLSGGGFGLGWGSRRQHSSVEYTMRDAIWFGNPAMHEDNNYPPVVVRLDHFPIPTPKAGDEAFVTATIVGEIGTADVEWSINGQPQPDIPMEAGQRPGRFVASLGILNDPGSNVEYLVRAESSAGNAMRSDSREFEVVARPEKRHDVLLVVDDTDGWQVNHIAPYYKRALDASHVGYDFWDTSILGPPFTGDLLPYVHGAVIWSVPRYEPWLWQWPNPDRVPDAIAEFLDAGGSLFMSGQEVAQHFRDRDPAWLADNLRAEHTWCCPTNGVESVGGVLFPHDLTFGLGGRGRGQQLLQPRRAEARRRRLGRPPVLWLGNSSQAGASQGRSRADSHAGPTGRIRRRASGAPGPRRPQPRSGHCLQTGTVPGGVLRVQLRVYLLGVHSGQGDGPGNGVGKPHLRGPRQHHRRQPRAQRDQRDAR